MKKFRKKPVEIKAAQWLGSSLADAKKFCQENGLPTFHIGSREGITGLIIPTLGGNHIAQKGDWIIKGIKGEYCPCKPDIFKATYEPV